MKKRLLILSGLSSRVADKLETRLLTLVDKVAYVSTAAKTGEADFDKAYFLALSKRAHDVTQLIPVRPNETILNGFLASFLPNNIATEYESDIFFPALRRIQLDYTLRNDLGRLESIYRVINSGIANYDGDKDFSKILQKDKRYLLPHKNIKVDTLRSNYMEIYFGNRTSLSTNIDRKIPPDRSNNGINTKGGLNFKGTINSGMHPIRRKSDCNCCDLQARFRFGKMIDERFEFDVTAKGELHGKSFSYCDGTIIPVTGGPDHLNMRINGDFEPAHR